MTVPLEVTAGKRLTARQTVMVEFISRYIEEHGYPPSIRDIQEGCDISSTSVVDYNLKRLEEKGVIDRGMEQARSIRLTTSGPVCPTCGRYRI